MWAVWIWYSSPSFKFLSGHSTSDCDYNLPELWDKLMGHCIYYTSMYIYVHFMGVEAGEQKEVGERDGNVRERSHTGWDTADAVIEISR